MNRREIYRRTKGYPSWGVGFAKILSVVLIVFMIVLVIKNPWLILRSDTLRLWALTGALILYAILSFWKYWLDIFKKDLVLFEGEVFSEGSMTKSRAESLWKNRGLVEKGTDAPRHFVICLRQMEKQYKNDTLIQDMCRGPVSFFYLKRTKCIVEIVSISAPESNYTNRHARKRAMKKAQRR